MIKISLLANGYGNNSNIIGVNTFPGDVGAASGLNWGYSFGLSHLSDAYIPIAYATIDQTLKLRMPIIPIKPNGQNIAFQAVWDDNEYMNILFEGNGITDNYNNLYPKQISTYGNKSYLGTYLRRRIGSKIGKNLIFSQYAQEQLNIIKKTYSGDKYSIEQAIQANPILLAELKDKFITRSDLIAYGRTDVDVILNGQGIYEFDFSV